MASGLERSGDDAPRDGSDDPDEERRVLLCMRSGRDRDLVAEALSARFNVETTADPSAIDSPFDCCVLDADTFDRAAGAIEPRRERAAPVFLPFVLLAGDDAARETAERAWELVDDVIDLPVRKRELRTRIGNLVERRRTAFRLADRERRRP